MQHNLRDTSRDHEHGRIYRITYPGRPLLKPVAIAGEPIRQLLDLLKEPEDRVRYRAKIELSGRNSNEVLAALTGWIGRLDKASPQYEHQMMEALWVQQWHNRVDPALLKRMLRSSEPWARAAATRVLCYWRDRVPDALALLEAQANDDASGRAARSGARGQLLPDARRRAHRQSQSRRIRRTVSSPTPISRRMNTLEACWAGTPTTTNAPADAAEHDGHGAAGPVRRADAPRPARQGRADHHHRHLPEQMLLRRPLVRCRGRQAGAVDAHQRRLHAPQHRHRPAGSVNPIGTAAATMPAPADRRAGLHARLSAVLEARAWCSATSRTRSSSPRRQKPGDYNFVCSFPGHWVRMYGVMLVVPSLDAFEAKPTVPNDPMTGKPYESQRVTVK